MSVSNIWHVVGVISGGNIEEKYNTFSSLLFSYKKQGVGIKPWAKKMFELATA